MEDNTSETSSCAPEREAAVQYGGTAEIGLGSRRSDTSTIEEIEVLLFSSENSMTNFVTIFVPLRRHSEHQIGYLEDKTHRARVRKHGSNYLLETYLKGLAEAVEPEPDDNLVADKNSDSGVVTEGDSEQSNTNNKAARSEVIFEKMPLFDK